MKTIKEEVYDLIKSRNPRLARVLKECSVYQYIDMPYSELFEKHGKNMSIEAISCMMADVFVNDERVTNNMAMRTELFNARAILKTDFGFIVADALGIGRNKAQYFVDQALIAGYFIRPPNTLDNNAKFIRPATVTNDELHRMYVRICNVNGTEITKEGFAIFAGKKTEDEDYIGE